MNEGLFLFERASEQHFYASGSKSLCLKSHDRFSLILNVSLFSIQNNRNDPIDDSLFLIP